MAGIGFSLRKILKHDNLTRLLAAYSTAGVVSTGPWIIAIFGILILGFFVSISSGYRQSLEQFQISITYLVAGSLIVSGFAQNSFSRYIADQLFLNKVSAVIPNLNGMMFVVTTISGVLSFLFVLFLFPLQTVAYRFLFIGSFVILSNLWVIINLLTGLKDYIIIVKAFFISYTLVAALAYLLRGLGLEGFMLSYLIGQLLLLAILQAALYKQYPTNSIIDFHFLKKNSMYKNLMVSGVFFNVAIWADKFVFWYSPSTSYHAIGPLRGSLLYDDAIFLAYLAVVPGMAVLLFLVETSFSDYYLRFNESIRTGKSLNTIQVIREQMVNYALNVIYSIVKIQALTIIIIFQLGETILGLFHISPLYKNLLFIDVIGTSLQVVCLGILNLLYYMDRRKESLLLTTLFLILNVVLSILSIYLGPFYYGFGFTGALVISCSYGMYLLSAEFSNLEYKVIMLR